ADDSIKRIGWPRRPGLFTFLAIAEVIFGVKNNAGGRTPGVKAVVHEGSKATTVEFAIELTNEVEARNLRDRITSEDRTGEVTAAVFNFRRCVPHPALRTASDAAIQLVDLFNQAVTEPVADASVQAESSPLLLLQWSVPTNV